MIDLLNDVYLEAYSHEQLYGIYMSMPFNELLKEARVSVDLMKCIHDNDMEQSILIEYLSGVAQITQLVVFERITKYLKGGDLKMIAVFRVVDGDFENKEIVALCNDLRFAENIVQSLLNDNMMEDNVMYVIGSGADL